MILGWETTRVLLVLLEYVWISILVRGKWIFLTGDLLQVSVSSKALSGRGAA